MLSLSGAGIDDAEFGGVICQKSPDVSHLFCDGTFCGLYSILAPNLNKNLASKYLEVDIATSGNLVCYVRFS